MTLKFSEELIEAYDYQQPRRGEIRSGVVLEIDEQGAFVDVGLKRDGFVPRQDIEKLHEETISDLVPGQEVKARVVWPRDRDNCLILSLAQVQSEKDWERAYRLLDQAEICQVMVTGYNRGGLVAKFGQLQAFIPASQLWQRERGELSQYIGQTLTIKVIEVDQWQDRLIGSEKQAEKELSEQHMDRLLAELAEGQVRQGKVTHLTHFGAFVDLGGADGLIHISEITWRRIEHPSEVLAVGNEIEVYVVKLDHKRRRINLSLKQLEPSPWQRLADSYEVDQLIAGVVTRVVDFGAFVRLETGLEGLLHVSE
nr:S1 RNA-binding domain-containing protein [Anaerolineae bacterium]